MIYTDRLIIKEEDIRAVVMSDTTIDIIVEEFGNVRIESTNVVHLTDTFKKLTAAIKEFDGEK